MLYLWYMSRYVYDMAPNTVQIIRTDFDNGTEVEVKVRQRGDARVYWASDWEIDQKQVDSGQEIPFGTGEYEISEMRNNVAILNQSDHEEHVWVEIREIVYIQRPPVSATSGFL